MPSVPSASWECCDLCGARPSEISEVCQNCRMLY
jgi:hypothetical protein